MQVFEIVIDFTSPPRLGSNVQSRSVHSIPADRLFSWMSLGWIRLFGVDDYRSTLQKFLSGKPSWRHSDLFPYKDEILWLPAPRWTPDPGSRKSGRNAATARSAKESSKAGEQTTSSDDSSEYKGVRPAASDGASAPEILLENATSGNEEARYTELTQTGLTGAAVNVGEESAPPTEGDLLQEKTGESTDVGATGESQPSDEAVSSPGEETIDSGASASEPDQSMQTPGAIEDESGAAELQITHTEEGVVGGDEPAQEIESVAAEETHSAGASGTNENDLHSGDGMDDAPTGDIVQQRENAGLENADEAHASGNEEDDLPNSEAGAGRVVDDTVRGEEDAAQSVTPAATQTGEVLSDREGQFPEGQSADGEPVRDGAADTAGGESVHPAAGTSASADHAKPHARSEHPIQEARAREEGIAAKSSAVASKTVLVDSGPLASSELLDERTLVRSEAFLAALFEGRPVRKNDLAQTNEQGVFRDVSQYRGWLLAIDDGLVEKLRASLEFMCDDGIGSRRSAGFGAMRSARIDVVEGYERLIPSARRKPSKHVILSPCCPTTEFVELVEASAPGTNNYSLAFTGGWIYDEEGHSTEIRKPVTCAFETGSAFSSKPEGRLLEVGTEDHPSYRYGFPFVLSS